MSEDPSPVSDPAPPNASLLGRYWWRFTNLVVEGMERENMLYSGLVAALIGIGSGYVNVAFHFLLKGSHYLFWELLGKEFLGISGGWGSPNWWLLPLVPAAGGAVLVLLNLLFPGDIHGYSLPRFLEMVNLRGGELRKRWVILKTLAASITIGSGGCSGVEGPTAVAGGSVGYAVACLLRIPRDLRRVLIACGSAGAIAAIFNAPIAGILFAEEIVLLGDFSLNTLSLTVVSAGIATVVTRTHFPNDHLFELPTYQVGISELPLFCLLGFLFGILAVVFIRLFFSTKAGFKKFGVPAWTKPILGGLLVGMMGWFAFEALGEGNSIMGEALRGHLLLSTAATLALVKFVAVGVTLGSGGAGGVFGPALFIGTMFGSALGSIFLWAFPSIVQTQATYSLVGMGTFLAAATHAPLTGIFLLFEVTDNYQVVLPTFFASFIAVTMARTLLKSSVDTFELERRGINLKAGFERNLMSSIRVRDVLKKAITVSESMPLSRVMKLLEETTQTSFPVVDRNGSYLGVVALADLRIVMLEQDLWHLLLVNDLERQDAEPLTTHGNMNDAIRLFVRTGLDELPVVNTDENGLTVVVGIVRRSDLVALYHRKILMAAAENVGTIQDHI